MGDVEDVHDVDEEEDHDGRKEGGIDSLRRYISLFLHLAVSPLPLAGEGEGRIGKEERMNGCMSTVHFPEKALPFITVLSCIVLCTHTHMSCSYVGPYGQCNVLLPH